MQKNSRNILFATAMLMAMLEPAAQLHARTTVTVVYKFIGSGHNDGYYPASLTVDAAGNLFGQTDGGGDCDWKSGCGTVFEIPANGQETILYDFPGKGGAGPQSELVEDQAGNLFGAVRNGGSCGYVYKIAADHTWSIVHTFKGGKDGCYPAFGLVADASGNLYGATSQGGGNECNGADGCGTVYRIAPDGTESVLYAFKGGASDGDNPFGGVVLDSSGNIYGTTLNGGDALAGTVFKISSGGEETLLHVFAITDGLYPFGRLLLGQNGVLYGTMIGSPNSCNCGAVFTVAADGTTSVLYSFKGGKDGGGVNSGLVLDGQGNIYGTTVGGGAHLLGTVFEISPAGKKTLLNSFSGGAKGANPSDGVIADQFGHLYGVTESGGRGCHNKGCGIIYEISR